VKRTGVVFVVLVSLALAGLAALAAGAAAATRASSVRAAECPPMSAKVTGGGATGVVEYSQAQPEGVHLKGTTIHSPGHFYELMRPVVLHLKGNTISVSKGSIFKLRCYRHSRTSRPLPGVDLMRGSLKIKSVEADPAGILTEEGLFDPRNTAKLDYAVKRTMTKRGELTLVQKMTWFASFGNQPMGTNTVASAGIVGVTPYVGARPGSCRYVHGARLTTTRGYGVGTAAYRA
jgi:hypothetical protein